MARSDRAGMLGMVTAAITVPVETAVDGGALIDSAAIAEELEALCGVHPGSPRELRSAVAQHLKAVHAGGRASAERLLFEERHGRRCAERLCGIQDELIRLLFAFSERHLYHSHNPSEAERMTVIATGGYGRGLLAPGSDIDLLFLLP
jgi:[protein-PII] uridylyltransferase